MSDVVTEVVSNQRRRLVATILGHLEAEVYQHLSPVEQGRVRAKVLAAVGSYSDFVIDVIRAANKGWVVNEEALRVLNQINENTRPRVDDGDA